MIRELSRLVSLFFALLISACTTLDTTLSNVGSALDTTNDILSGDFRGFTSPTQTTLSQIHADWRRNELNAQKKYSQTVLAIPGIVTRVSKSTIITDTHRQQPVFMIAFRDPKNSQCNGIAYMRDDLPQNAKVVSQINAGDRILVTGVMENHVGSVVSATSCSFSFKKAKIMVDSGATATNAR